MKDHVIKTFSLSKEVVPELRTLSKFQCRTMSSIIDSLINEEFRLWKYDRKEYKLWKEERLNMILKNRVEEDFITLNDNEKVDRVKGMLLRTGILRR